MSRTGESADLARAEVRESIAAKGHTVDNARTVVARLERAFGTVPSSGPHRWTCSSPI